MFLKLKCSDRCEENQKVKDRDARIWPGVRRFLIYYQKQIRWIDPKSLPTEEARVSLEAKRFYDTVVTSNNNVWIPTYI